MKFKKIQKTKLSAIQKISSLGRLVFDCLKREIHFNKTVFSEKLLQKN